LVAYYRFIGRPRLKVNPGAVIPGGIFGQRESDRCASAVTRKACGKILFAPLARIKAGVG
jgi:hypothetical protein